MSGMPVADVSAYTRIGNCNNININYEKVQIKMEKFLPQVFPLPIISFWG
jgi:hypothetical protein